MIERGQSILPSVKVGDNVLMDVAFFDRGRSDPSGWAQGRGNAAASAVQIASPKVVHARSKVWCVILPAILGVIMRTRTLLWVLFSTRNQRWGVNFLYILR